jgi:GntR family transcriptional repressor for pyruvate dehydrogenase complex
MTTSHQARPADGDDRLPDAGPGPDVDRLAAGGVEGDDDLPFTVLTQEALYQRIANHVRDLIVSQRLQPGERLPAERELARLLGVSRVPIREAMRTLAAQGYVEVRRGQGMFVATSSVEATVDELTKELLKQRDLLAELFAVRRLLEPASAQWAAARATPEDVAKLVGILQEIEAAGDLDPPDYETLGKCDTELHVQIADAAANRVLIRIMQAIQDLHREQLETSLRYRGRIHETIKDHRRIVRAIGAGDPVEAREAMIDHLSNSEAATMARIEGSKLDGGGPPG